MTLALLPVSPHGAPGVWDLTRTNISAIGTVAAARPKSLPNGAEGRWCSLVLATTASATTSAVLNAR